MVDIMARTANLLDAYKLKYERVADRSMFLDVLPKPIARTGM
jgi:hypothetical protein